MAVARSDGSGGGGDRAVMRLVRREGEGGGKFCDVMAARSCDVMSMMAFNERCDEQRRPWLDYEQKLQVFLV